MLPSNRQSAISNPQLGARALAAWEIVSVVTSVVIAEWVVFAVAGDSAPALAFPVGSVLVFMFLSHRARGETAREVGWRMDNFGRAAKLLLPPMLILSVPLLTFGWLAGNLDLTRWRGGQTILGTPALGALWGFLQQYALQGFINRRAQLLWGPGRKSVLLVAIVFALLHLPNPWLTAATFAAGLLWAYTYQRAPNLFALGLSHAAMTWVLVSAVPPQALHNLRVGFKFFR